MDDKMEDTCVLSHGQMKALVERMRQAKDEKFIEHSRKRLDKIVSTKVRTTFIGALAAFEDEFGFLWGHDLPEDQLTVEQQSMLELWKNVRTIVLDNGNTQLRAVKSEIANHVIKWNRYHMEFQVQKQEKKL
jgi:hypothetical protein